IAAEHPVRRELAIAVAFRPGDDSGRGPPRHFRAEELDACFGLRDVEPASLAGAAAMLERGQQRDKAEARPDIVRIWPERSDRELPLVPDDALEARHRRADI